MESRTWKYFDHHHHHQVCFFPCGHLLYKRLLQKTSLAPWCEFIFLPPAWTKSEQWIMALATDVVPCPGMILSGLATGRSKSFWAISTSSFHLCNLDDVLRYCGVSFSALRRAISLSFHLKLISMPWTGTIAETGKGRKRIVYQITLRKAATTKKTLVVS